jgi:hypothetical protein
MKRFFVLLSFVLLNIPILTAQNVNGIIISDSVNLTVVKIWGTHEERGFAYGYLLGGQISDMFTNYLAPILGTNLEEARQIIIDGEDLSIDPEFVQEAIAVVEGMNLAGTNYANIDYIDGLVSNAFLDILKLLGFATEGPGCSSLMSWGDATLGTGLDGKSVISRHLDWTPHPTLINNQVIVIHLPSEEDEQPWAMVGFAGQMSVLSGFNQNIAVFQHMMSDFSGPTIQSAGFEPVWLTLRKSIEKLDFNNDGINNTQDVWDAINQNTMGYADGYILTALAPSSSGADSLIALVAEVTPQEPLITFRTNSYPDAIPGDNLYAANYEIKRNNHNHYCPRYNAVKTALGEGTGIGQEENWQIMRDYSNASFGNIQFMQFIPETDLFRITVYRDGSPAYLKPPTDFTISGLFLLPVGIAGYNQNSARFIFPNPAYAAIHVMFDKDEKGNSFQIYSIDGHIVMEGEIVEEYQTISIQHLNRGIYLFKENRNAGIKFIKEN